MPHLVIGGVEGKVMEMSRLADEQGDWPPRANWSVKLLLQDDAEAAALRTAVQAQNRRTYRRMVNGDLRGGPLIACSGDRLGGAYTCGIEIGEQDLVITRHTPPVEFHYTLPLTLREA